MKIDILVAGNPYGTTTHFAKGLASGLAKNGAQARLFWVDDGQFYHAQQEICNDPPDLTCSFSDINFNGNPLADFWGIPHLSWLVDPPVYFLHQMRSPLSIVACVDAHDAAFVTNLKACKSFFLPHAGDESVLMPVDTYRPYEAVFFGTCIDYEMIAQNWPEQERELLLEASKKVLSHEGVTIMQALHDLKVPSIDIPRLHNEVDLYTRGKDRVELIRSFQLPVHIWGDGPWKKYLPHHYVNPPIGFEEVIRIMQQSQIVLNSAPRFKGGAHERIFYALLCGAAVYTGANSFIAEHLPEVITYHFGSWSPLLSLPQVKETAFIGQQRVLDYHTWNVRAASLIENFKL